MVDRHAQTKYNIFCKGEKIFQDLTEDQFFDKIEDLAQEFYKTGSPCPSDITTEIIGD